MNREAWAVTGEVTLGGTLGLTPTDGLNVGGSIRLRTGPRSEGVVCVERGEGGPDPGIATFRRLLVLIIITSLFAHNNYGIQ